MRSNEATNIRINTGPKHSNCKNLMSSLRMSVKQLKRLKMSKCIFFLSAYDLEITHL